MKPRSLTPVMRRLLGRVAPVACLALAAGCMPPLRIQRQLDDLDLDARRGDLASVESRETKILEMAGNYYGHGSVPAARIGSDLALSYARWGWDEKAMKLSARVLAQAEAAGGACSEALAYPTMDLASIHEYAGRWNEALVAAEQAYALCTSLYPPGTGITREDQPCLSPGAWAIPDHFFVAGAPGRAVAADLRLKWLVPRHADERSALLGLSLIARRHLEYGEYAEAIWYLRRCVDEGRLLYDRPRPARSPRSPYRRVELVTLDSPDAYDSQEPRCLPDLIELLERLGREDETTGLVAWRRELWARGPDAEVTIRERLDANRRSWRDELVEAHWLSTLAGWHAGHARWDAAIAAYRDAVAAIEQWQVSTDRFAAERPSLPLADVLAGLGRALEMSGRPGDAVPNYERAANLFAAGLHPRRGPRLLAMAGAARSLHASGQNEPAIDAWQRYLAVAADVRGRDHADYAVGLAGLADAFAAGGRPGDAAKARREAEAIRTAWRRRVDEAHDLPIVPALLPPSAPAT